jgi:phosphohistidine phosphatase
MCPHWAHRRRWNHQPPVFSHSTQPGPDGGTLGSIPGIAVTGPVHQPDGVRRKSPAGGARLASVAPRRLLLVRHAQAANAPLDRDRPLTDHGTEQARAIGTWLAERALVPDRALVSPARRAAQTWAAAAERLSGAAEPTFDERLYANTLDAVLAAIREFPDGVRCLAVVGHNPSIGALAHELGNGSFESGFPAGGVAVFELAGTYAALEPGTARLSDVHLPGR